MDLAIEMLRKTVDEFGRKELLNVGYSQLEQKGEFPSELVAKISQMGLMGISFPEEYGGMGMNTVATSVVGERLAFYWPSLQLIWSANVSLAGFPIMTFGSEDQKRRLLPRLATGEILGCYALTEPNAGSDAASIETTCEWVEDVTREDLVRRGYWLLSGAKTFITNADKASVCVLFAKIKGKGSAPARISAFLLENWEGYVADFEVPRVEFKEVPRKEIPKWGLRCSHFCEVTLSGIRIKSQEMLKDWIMLGEPNEGWRIAMETLNNGRINIAAQAVGIARRALYEAKNYAKMRRAFGKTLMEMDVRAFKLAELEARVDAAWQLVLAASMSKDAGQDYRSLASKAKLVASELAVECALENYRVHGGFGYTTESIAISILHDALATVTYEGTSDIQKLTIARSFRE